MTTVYDQCMRNTARSELVAQSQKVSFGAAIEGDFCAGVKRCIGVSLGVLDRKGCEHRVEIGMSCLGDRFSGTHPDIASQKGVKPQVLRHLFRCESGAIERGLGD